MFEDRVDLTPFSKGPWRVAVVDGVTTVLVQEDVHGTETTGPNQCEHPLAVHPELSLGQGRTKLMRDAAFKHNDAVLVAASRELYAACIMQRFLIRDMVRFLKHMALQDYALLNEAMIAADVAIREVEEGIE